MERIHASCGRVGFTKGDFFDNVVGGCDFETALDIFIQKAVSICEEELA